MQARASYSHYWWTRLYWRNHKGEKLDFKLHRYLEKIYKDTSPDITVEKAAQLGFSEYALSRAFFVADKLNGNVGYFFPAAGQVYDHVQMRVDPVTESSEYLKAITGKALDVEKKADKVSLKRVRNAFIMFRGAQNPRQVTSAPLDFAILDEYDRFEGVSISMIEKRLNHSKLKWILNVSTPTYEGTGVDLEMQNTDCMQWHIKCKACKKDNVLSYFENVDTDAYIITCSSCHVPWSIDDIQQGYWKPKYPQNKRRGYKVTGLLNPYFDAKKIVEKIGSYNEFVVQEAYNQDLGLPYKSQGNTISQQQIDACQGEYTIPFTRKNTDRLFAGVDVGRTSWMIVGRENKETKKIECVGFHELKSLETDLPYYMQFYDLRACVIDALPETNIVTRLSNQFAGRLFAAHYDYHTINGAEYTKIHEGGGVTIHRTAGLDEVYGRIRSGNIVLPKHAKYIHGLYEHLMNQDRVMQTIGKQEMYVYVDNGKPDHYAHAMNYMLAASSLMPSDFVNVAKGDTMRTRLSSDISNKASIHSAFNTDL